MPENVETPVVLCVDDEASILNALRRVLMEEDWEVLYARDGQSGLEVFAEARPHLVLSDFRMPGMDGVDFLKRTKEIDPDCMRIVLSGYADVKVVVSALNEGEIYRFIGKPWNDGELLDVLRKALAHRSAEMENRRLRRELARKVAERTAELKLKGRSLHFVQTMLEMLPMPIVGVNTQSIVVCANAAARDLYDSTGEGVVGVRASDVFDHKIAVTIRRVLRTGQAEGNVLPMTFADAQIGVIVLKENDHGLGEEIGTVRRRREEHFVRTPAGNDG